MNIFAVSDCPKECAMYLDDKRLVKMVLETAQLLSTTLHYYTGDSPYKPTHLNHPVAKWVRSGVCNYLWTLDYFKELCSEYTKRYKKVHKCQGLLPHFNKIPKDLPKNNKIQEFVNCTEFKDIKDVRSAYKTQLMSKWTKDKRPATCRIH